MLPIVASSFIKLWVSRNEWGRLHERGEAGGSHNWFWIGANLWRQRWRLDACWWCSMGVSSFICFSWSSNDQPPALSCNYSWSSLNRSQDVCRIMQAFAFDERIRSCWTWSVYLHVSLHHLVALQHNQSLFSSLTAAPRGMEKCKNRSWGIKRYGLWYFIKVKVPTEGVVAGSAASIMCPCVSVLLLCLRICYVNLLLSRIAF